MTDDRRLTDPFKDDLHTLIEHVGDMKGSLARIEEKMLKVDDHHKTLYGINGLPGLTIVVDRLEQVEKDRSGKFMLAWTAIIGLAAERAWAFLTHKGP